MKVDIRCKTPRCIGDIAKYGENYHEVHAEKAPDFMPDAVAKCGRCGGYTNGTDWKHVCKMCGKEMQPGELVGWFVPHRCSECDAKVVAEDKAKGRICGRCHQVISYCCC